MATALPRTKADAAIVTERIGTILTPATWKRIFRVSPVYISHGGFLVLPTPVAIGHTDDQDEDTRHTEAAQRGE